MYIREFFDHVNPDGKDPFQRMSDAGYNYSNAGENIAAGDTSATAWAFEDLLMVDAGVPERGHRKNLLSIYSSPPFREVGPGYFEGGSPNSLGLSNFLVQDFATAIGSSAFIVGVVYDDLDGDNFYDVGEGLAGVTVLPAAGT